MFQQRVDSITPKKENNWGTIMAKVATWECVGWTKKNKNIKCHLNKNVDMCVKYFCDTCFFAHKY